MKEQLVAFETAKLAKEKGFNEYSPKSYYIEGNDEIAVYDSGEMKFCYAPTQSLLQKWLREEHNIHLWIPSKTIDKGKTIFIPCGRTIPDSLNDKGLVKDIIPYKAFSIYEQAREEGLKQSLKFIK